MRARKRASQDRRGAAAVEFAVVAPVFVALALTAAQSSFNLDTAHTLYAAIRQAGRLASMDTSERLQQGQSKNEKIIQDIRNQLTAEGLPGQEMIVKITAAEDGSDFDLADANNDLKLFRIRIEVPYSTLNKLNVFPASMDTMHAEIVFRKGRTTLVQ